MIVTKLVPKPLDRVDTTVYVPPTFAELEGDPRDQFSAHGVRIVLGKTARSLDATVIIVTQEVGATTPHALVIRDEKGVELFRVPDADRGQPA